MSTPITINISKNAQGPAGGSKALAPVATSGSAADLASGTLPDARLSPKVKSLADLATPSSTSLLAMNSSGQVVETLTMTASQQQQALANIGSGIRHIPLSLNTFGGFAGNSTNSTGGATGFGVLCMNAITAAQDSTGMGTYALRYMQTGVGNSAFGAYSLEKSVTGGNNTAVGDSSLRECLTVGNTAMGYVCLGIVTTGEFNNGFGRGVLGSCVTGSRNNGFGNEVLATATGNDNCAFGHNSLYNLTVGGNNVAIGNRSGLLHQLGSNNVFIGDEAAGVTGQGVEINNSIVIGRRAVTGLSNAIVIGTPTHTRAQIFGGLHSHGALNVATNQCMGAGSAYNATGGNNSTYGVSAAFSLTTGIENEAIGWQALYFTTTGFRNVAIGNSSLQSNVVGYHNTAVGRASGLLTTGFENSYFGQSAGASITTGTNNTFVGNLAGSNASQIATAVNSMALGNGAFTTANNQVVIGNTDVTSTILRGNVFHDGAFFCRTAVVAPIAGGAQAIGFASNNAVGLYWGSGAPSVAAGQGSIYIRTDGSATNNRMYINTNGSTTWTAVTTQI